MKVNFLFFLFLSIVLMVTIENIQSSKFLYDFFNIDSLIKNNSNSILKISFAIILPLFTFVIHFLTNKSDIETLNFVHSIRKIFLISIVFIVIEIINYFTFKSDLILSFSLIILLIFYFIDEIINLKIKNIKIEILLFSSSSLIICLGNLDFIFVFVIGFLFYGLSSIKLSYNKNLNIEMELFNALSSISLMLLIAISNSEILNTLIFYYLCYVIFLINITLSIFCKMFNAKKIFETRKLFSLLNFLSKKNNNIKIKWNNISRNIAYSENDMYPFYFLFSITMSFLVTNIGLEKLFFEYYPSQDFNRFMFYCFINSFCILVLGTLILLVNKIKVKKYMSYFILSTTLISILIFIWFLFVSLEVKIMFFYMFLASLVFQFTVSYIFMKLLTFYLMLYNEDELSDFSIALKLLNNIITEENFDEIESLQKEVMNFIDDKSIREIDLLTLAESNDKDSIRQLINRFRIINMIKKEKFEEEFDLSYFDKVFKERKIEIIRNKDYQNLLRNKDGIINFKDYKNELEFYKIIIN